MVGLLLLTTIVSMVLLQRVLSRVDHAGPESLKSIASDFRWLLIGLGVWFLLVINVCVVMLFRMSSMILRPVDALIMGTRELAQEHFDHRVKVEENNEFDELARAYNRLAEHLEQTEKRRIETLGQVAIALNHELNNAMATIFPGAPPTLASFGARFCSTALSRSLATRPGRNNVPRVDY